MFRFSGLLRRYSVLSNRHSRSLPSQANNGSRSSHRVSANNSNLASDNNRAASVSHSSKVSEHRPLSQDSGRHHREVSAKLRAALGSHRNQVVLGSRRNR